MGQYKDKATSNSKGKMYALFNPSSSPRPTVQGGEPSRFSSQNRRPQQEPQQQVQQQLQKTPDRKTPKVRTSCDSCATAKVRCSKERPRCERCIECNFSCVYGLSMKHGKRSQKGRHPAFQPTTDDFQSNPLSSGQKHDNDLQQSFSDLLENIGSTANVSSIQPWPASNEIGSKSTTMNPAPPAAASPASDDLSWPHAIADGRAGTGSAGNMSPTNRDPAFAHLESLDDNFSILPNTDFSQLINPEPSDSVISPSSSASPIIPYRNISLLQPQISDDGSGAHDCYVIANSTLAILHVSPRPMSNDNGNDVTSTLSSNHAARVPMQAAQHLDEVLRCTRDAMGNVLHLLRCSCASDPQMAMLDASIIIRILFWHQIAAGVKASTSLPLPSWDGLPLMQPFAATGRTASRSHPGFCSSSTAFVASEPIKIGNYIPDQEDQEPMRRLFLLISLKKLGRLIELFAQVGDPVDIGPSHVRGVLASWLSSELSQTVKVVGKGAKTTVGQQS